MTSTLFGLHDATNGSYDQVPVGAVRLWDVGVTWKDIETSPGVYDYTRMNDLVDEAESRGAAVTYVLGQCPSFYTAKPDDCPAYSVFENYVRDVMTEFKGRIDSYQIWNEINVSLFWDGTMAEMADLTEIVWRVRNEVDPDALVVAPSGPVRMKYQRLLYEDYLKTTDLNYIDVYALSLYPMPSGIPEDLIALIDSIRVLLNTYGQASKPLWIAEINYGVGSQTYVGGIARAISETEQISNVIRTYVIAAVKNIERCFWYRWDWGVVTHQDADGNKTMGTLGNTLLTNPVDKKTITEAGMAFGRVQDWLRGESVAMSRIDNTFVVLIQDGARRKRIVWNPHSNPTMALISKFRTSQRGTTRRRTKSTIRVTGRPVLLHD